MKKLPKGLKTWPAYSELKKKLDNFNECLPLLELLINPAMQVNKIIFNPLSPGGTHMYQLENFQILEFLRILEKYFQQMLEASRCLYKIAWIIECMDDIERCTLRSFDPTPRGNSLESVPEFTSASSEWNETFRACTCSHSCRFKKN